MSKKRHVVARASDLKPGDKMKVSAGGRELALFNVGGSFYALADKCPHEAGSLCEGKLVGLAESDMPGDYRYSRRGEFVKCPWHGWEFDIRTGQSYCDPETMRVRKFEAHVETGDELLRGPYIAERFEVSVENDYVVIEV